MSNMTITQFAAYVKHDEQMLIARMKHDGILQSSGRPYQEYARRGYFPMGEHGERPAGLVLTGKGQIWLIRKYPAGCELGVAG